MGLLGAGGGAASLLVALTALLAPQQVSGGGQCFRLDGLRLLAHLADALRQSGEGGGGGGAGGGGGGGGAWGLRLCLHVAPPQAELPVSQLLQDDLPEARIGRTRITLDPYRSVLEVEGFPADLEVGSRDDSPMNTVVDTGQAVPVEEVPIEGNTILRDLQLLEEGSHPPGHVVLSVDPWSAHAQGLTLLPQLAVVVRTSSGLSCELALPATVDGARRLLGHVSQLEARHEIAEVVLLNAELLQEPLMDCETLVWAESPPPAPVFISPGSVLAAWRVSGGGLWLGPRLQSLVLPLPPTSRWGVPTPPPLPPPVQLRACLPHSGLQADGVPDYWRKVFALITEAISPHLTISEPPANESADNPRKQDPPATAPPAVAPPPLFHRRARRSYITVASNTFVNDFTINNVWQKRQQQPPSRASPPYFTVVGNIYVKGSTINNVWQGHPPDRSSQSGSRGKHRDTGVRMQGNTRGQPCHISVANRRVAVPRMHHTWPFQKHAKSIPRYYAWRQNTWEELSNKNGEWKMLTPRRSLNPESHMRRPLYVFINDIWLLLTSADILWDKTTNSIYPKKLLQYQPNSSPAYVCINGNWVPITYNKNQWILASSDEGKKKSTTSQNKEQIVSAWDYLFPMNNRPDQQGSSHILRPGGSNSGNYRPSDGLLNEWGNSPPGKDGKDGKEPKIQQIPLPFGSYKEEGAPQASANNCRCCASHYDVLKSPTGKGKRQTRSVKLPFPYNEKWTSSRLPNTGNQGSHNDGRKSPPGKGKNQPNKQHLPLPFGSYKVEGIPTAPPNSENKCPFCGSHYDGSKSPPGKGEKQTGNVNIPLPYGSYNEKWSSSRLPNTGNQGSHNEGWKSPPGKGKNQQDKQHLPLPFGSYKVEGIPPAPPNSANNFTCCGSHYDGSKLPPGKGEDQTGNVNIPLPYGSYNEKWTSSRLTNTGNLGSHNDGWKSPPGKEKNQPDKQLLPLPFGSYKVEGIPPAPPKSANNCPCRGSHYDGSTSLPGNIKNPLPYGSYNEKWTSSRLPNTGNSCPC